MEPMYGKYRAEVVDRNDPLGQGRLRVQATAVLGRRAAVWATACLPPGYAALPDVGDTVWIMLDVDGVVRGATLIATEGVVSPSYTPGAGNVW